MKRLLLVIAVIIANLSLSSCTNDDVAENESLYDTRATGGEDRDIIPPEEPEALYDTASEPGEDGHIVPPEEPED